MSFDPVAARQLTRHAMLTVPYSVPQEAPGVTGMRWSGNAGAPSTRDMLAPLSPDIYPDALVRAFSASIHRRFHIVS